VRYCRGVDRTDTELLASTYHPGAVDDHGVFRGDAQVFAEQLGPLLEQAFDATHHFLGQSLIELAGDVAHAETYVIAVHRRGSGEKAVLETFGARYLDRLTRRAGEWRIQERVVVNEWARVDDVKEPPLAAQLAQGLRSRDDLAYRREGSLLD
jgi:hypothetical protein